MPILYKTAGGQKLLQKGAKSCPVSKNACKDTIGFLFFITELKKSRKY